LKASALGTGLRKGWGSALDRPQKKGRRREANEKKNNAEEGSRTLETS